MSAFQSSQCIDELPALRSPPVRTSRRLVPARGGLGYACGADAGDTGNLLDREMRPPEPQQTGIAIGAWQGLEHRRIYARKHFARNGKDLLIGDPPAWKNLH